MAAFEAETTRFLNAWMEVRQLVQAANFNRFQRAGLSATQFMTLNVIPAHGMTLSELARRLNLGAATLNGTVNTLEERGFLQRHRDPGDARKWIIVATTEGGEVQNSASREFHTFMAELLVRMSDDGREGLLTGLEEMISLNPARPTAGATRRGADAPPVKRSSRRSRPR